jgi:hypothetical protein
MESPILNDKDQYPTDEIIFTHLGKSKTHWLSLFKYIDENHPGFIKEWRYYNDGKSWLLKTVDKKKTIFWTSIIKNGFRTGFYFGDKAEDVLLKSKLPKVYKDQFVNGKRYGKIRGLTVIPKSKKDLEVVKILITIKVSIK